MKLRRSRTEINLLKEQVEVLSNATAGGSEEIIICLLYTSRCV